MPVPRNSIGDAAQMARHFGDVLLACVIAKPTAGHRDLGELLVLNRDAAIVLKRRRDFAKPQRAALVAAGKDDVLHRLATQVLGRLLTQHQRIASTTFDLPQPFGSTTQMIGPSKRTTILSQNHLKPVISRRLMRITNASRRSDRCSYHVDVDVDEANFARRAQLTFIPGQRKHRPHAAQDSQ